MHTTQLRKVGGSVMIAIPPHLLDQLQLQPGSGVGLRVAGHTIVIEPSAPKYTLEELLAECDNSQGLDEDSEDWLSSPPTGRELL